MRERLTLAFVVLTILLLLGAGIVRSFVLRDLIREQEAQHLGQEVALISTIVEDREETGATIDEEFLQSLVNPAARLEYDPKPGEPIVVTGPDYEGSGDPSEDLSSTVMLADSTITLSQSDEVVRDILGRDMGSLAALFLLIAVVAGIAGFLIASAMSSPFQRLAVAAAALGRGRYDLELPKTRIPEALAISNALRASAHQLEDRVQRERDFAEHASHVLRTPLTGLRLELEDLTLRDDVPDDVKESAARSLTAAEHVGTAAAELVELTRRGSLMEGSEMALVDLATQLAQRWADRLGVANRTLTAAAEGELSLSYTPGPVEQVTDLLLTDVLRRGTGPVRIVFFGEEDGHLRIQVECEGRRDGGPAGDAPGEPGVDRISQVRSVVEALGGRMTGDHPADGIELRLPQR